MAIHIACRSDVAPDLRALARWNATTGTSPARRRASSVSSTSPGAAAAHTVEAVRYPSAGCTPASDAIPAATPEPDPAVLLTTAIAHSTASATFVKIM